MEVVELVVAPPQINVEKAKETVMVTMIVLVIFCVDKVVDMTITVMSGLAFPQIGIAAMTQAKVIVSQLDTKL